MTRMNFSSLFALVVGLLLFCQVRSGGIRGRKPYEERESNFHHQNVKAAINIEGKVYVIKRNYRTSAKHRCLYSQRAAKYNETKYLYTLGATPSYSSLYLVKFTTTLYTLKTGTHAKYNAVKYHFRPSDPPKIQKLMYIDKKGTCIIFVDNRKSESQKAKCQLMRPARFANEPLPEQCSRVYKQNCHGEIFKVYRKWCQSLPEKWYKVYKRRKSSASRPKQPNKT